MRGKARGNGCVSKHRCIGAIHTNGSMSDCIERFEFTTLLPPTVFPSPLPFLPVPLSFERAP